MDENTTVAGLNESDVLALMRDPDAFEKYFKKKAFNEKLGCGQWNSTGKRAFRFTLTDGSYVQIKFFDTIKRIYNSKNVEVPGRESFLSYIDVSVFPAGMKAYTFISDMAQHVWAYSKGRKPAKESHAESIAKLKLKAFQININLDNAEDWETYFARHFQKKDDK